MAINNVLIVCFANICRSPTAEAVFRNSLMELPEKNSIRVHSAGINARVNIPMESTAQEILSERGITNFVHRSQPLTKILIEDNDLILVMEHWHREEIVRKFPLARGKTFLLGHWEGCEIADPYQMEKSDYHAAFDLIQKSVNSWLQRISRKEMVS